MNMDDFENIVPQRVSSDNADVSNKVNPIKKDSSDNTSDLMNKKNKLQDDNGGNDALDKVNKPQGESDMPDTSDVANPTDASTPNNDNFFDTSSDKYNPHDDPDYENDGGAPAEPEFDDNDANYDTRQDGYHENGNAGEKDNNNSDSKDNNLGKESSGGDGSSKPTDATSGDKEGFTPDKVFGDLTGDGHVSDVSSGTDTNSVANMLSRGAKQAANTGLSILKSLAAVFSNGFTTIANALGTSVKMVKILGSVTGTTSIILIVALLLGIQNKKMPIYEVDCDVVDEQANSNNGSTMDGGDMTANAKTIYSALASDSIGYTDQAIAGMLSNAQAETHIDPTVYEGNYINDSTMKKYAEEKNWHEYTKKLFGYYAVHGPKVDESAYMYDGKYYPAFGLWQWTGPRTGGLMKFACGGETGSDGELEITDEIYNIDKQLAYLIRENQANVNDWGRTTSASMTPYECAVWFHSKWECSSYARAAHCDPAQSWYDTITSEGWATNDTYGKSIIDMAQTELSEAGARGFHSVYDDTICEEPEVNNFDNSSIAAAAVGWAWPKDHADYADINDSSTKCCGSTCMMSFCTSQYIYCHNLVLQGFPTHASSCDRGAAVAIRVAGVDDNFNPGTIDGTCLPYLKSSENWENLGLMNDRVKNELQPGDILCRTGHIVVFVGGEEAAKKWPDLYKNADACKYGIVHASHSSTYASDGSSSRGPRFDPDCGTWMYGEFYAFRPKSRTKSSKYKKLIDANAPKIAEQKNGSKPVPASEVKHNAADYKDKLFGMDGGSSN